MVVIVLRALLALQGVGLAVSLLCSQPRGLVGDLDNCHIFYQCHINPQPRSCGELMFNTITQVCDWPSKVMQIRAECRDVTKLGLIQFPFYRQRALRMIQNYGDGDRNSVRRNRVGYNSNVELKSGPDHEYDIIVLSEREYKDSETKDKPTNIVENTLSRKPYYQRDSLLDAVRLESFYRTKEKLNFAFKGPIPVYEALNNDIQAPRELQFPAADLVEDLVEETREYKPLNSCHGGTCQKQRQRRFLKVKRRLPVGETRILQDRRRELQERLSQDNQLHNSEMNREVRTDFKIINRN